MRFPNFEAQNRRTWTLLAARRKAFQQWMDAVGSEEKQERFEEWNRIRHEIERVQSGKYEEPASNPKKPVGKAKANLARRKKA